MLKEFGKHCWLEIGNPEGLELRRTCDPELTKNLPHLKSGQFLMAVG